MFQAPTGTRDFYPADLNRLRYIQEAWRRTSINHGFDEIDGPAFEHLDLYTVKSGEGIISELFSFERFGGEKTFALRPEFTPTLARMYASKAASLPRPTKWFWQQNCYRAERPQRGRLREFCQWNCDIIGSDSTPAASGEADFEAILTCISLLESLGLQSKDIRVGISSRSLLASVLFLLDVPEEEHPKGFALLDARAKLEPKIAEAKALQMGFSLEEFDKVSKDLQRVAFDSDAWNSPVFRELDKASRGNLKPHEVLVPMVKLLQLGLEDWCGLDLSIARGLAYYTGMVFEVHEASGAERAIAGGGRYDKLIEMFGGPPTPAVGFGMGDVVLSLVLQDKGLMPTDEDVADKLGLNPDALVISNGTPEADGAVAGVIAALRRPTPQQPKGLHVRRSYKTTKNIGKLMQDAVKTRARYCVILESAERATVKDMGTQGQEECAVGELAARLRGSDRSGGAAS